jgi:hypothetical protein
VAHKLDTRNGDRQRRMPLIPLREVAAWEHDLHAAMENIQDEIDLVESAASIDAYAQPTRRSVLPYCRNISSAHQNCSPHVSRRFGNVSAILCPGSVSVYTIALSANDPVNRVH